jgi:hypothetical protein
VISGQWAESSFRRPSTAAEPATDAAADASGAVGVDELDQEKLTPLLRLKYHDRTKKLTKK